MKRKINWDLIIPNFGAGLLLCLLALWVILLLVNAFSTPVCHWSHKGNFCATCGEAFAQQCPSCSKWCRLDITYCPECGYLLEE